MGRTRRGRDERFRDRLFPAGAGLLLLFCSPQFAMAAPTYVEDIRPIFERRCYGCHGAEKQRSKYRLDVRDTALKGGSSGKAAIIPHDSGNSPLVHFISGENPDTQMPPKSSGLPALTAAEVETIRAWIDAG